MDIKCKNNPYYFLTPSYSETTVFQRARSASRQTMRKHVELGAELCEDIFVRRPVANESATGLLSFVTKCKNTLQNYARAYVKNIKHTYDHKIIFALIEKELYGKNSIDSLTHDLDKLVMYSLGFPKSIVSKVHRNISEHHIESGKKMNLKSMLCDNIASSPEFKPEKKKSLRDYYLSNKDLQNLVGFGELLEKYNYGENLDFDAIKQKKEESFISLPNQLLKFAKTLSCLVF